MKLVHRFYDDHYHYPRAIWLNEDGQYTMLHVEWDGVAVITATQIVSCKKLKCNCPGAGVMTTDYKDETSVYFYDFEMDSKEDIDSEMDRILADPEAYLARLVL